MKNQKINNTQVLVGQPVNYPNELISSMKNIFEFQTGVQKAFIACIQYADPKSSSKILVGLGVNGDIEKIISDIRIQIENYDTNQIEFTDAVNGKFNNYFSKIKPFYNRII